MDPRTLSRPGTGAAAQRGRTSPPENRAAALRESDSMLARRHRDNKDKTLSRLPDTVARLVSFTICARTARRMKTTTIKVLTTLLAPDAFSACEIAACTPKDGRQRSLTCT